MQKKKKKMKVILQKKMLVEKKNIKEKTNNIESQKCFTSVQFKKNYNYNKIKPTDWRENVEERRSSKNGKTEAGKKTRDFNGAG